jgi:4-amino-4-deoxy-L-arabinose transferase-like glycosyltransferase
VAVATLFIYKTGETFILHERAYCQPYYIIRLSIVALSAAYLILPDSPQMLFWTMGLFFLAKLLKTKENKTLWWVLFGFASGLAIMSKVHGVFFVVRVWPLHYILSKGSSSLI